MVGLLDIAPSTRTVKVGDQELAVLGVSAHGIAFLLQRFPELRELLGGSPKKLDLDVGKLVEMVPDAISAIIAAGCGYPGNADAEVKASEIPADTQLELLSAILELTMPKGAGPFFVKLQAVMSSLDVSGKVPGMLSPSPSSSS